MSTQREPACLYQGRCVGIIGKSAQPCRGMARFWSWRYIILRRISQFGILLMFFGTAHWGWQVAKDVPLLIGNLSASKFIGLIPLTDPFAALQIFLTGHVLQRRV
jgi:ferredoxin-type protein NapH